MTFEHMCILQPGIALNKYPSLRSQITPHTKYVILQQVRPGTFDQLFFEKVARSLVDSNSSTSFQYIAGKEKGETTRLYMCIINSSLQQMTL